MEWLIAANHKKYDHTAAFNEMPYIDWKQNANYEVGDIVYIYSSKPIMAIEYKVEVIDTNITGTSVRDDKRFWKDLNQYESGRTGLYARFKLKKMYKKNMISLENLHDHGLKGNIQGPRRLYDNNGDLTSWGKYIHKQTTEVPVLTDKEKRYSMLSDIALNQRINNMVFNNNKSISYKGIKKEKDEPIVKNGISVYPRNAEISKNALIIANHKCEYNHSHESFLRKSNHTIYMEAHHLVPLEFSNLFNVSLDVEENIVSLCSNCHNMIHYGLDNNSLIKKLYVQRKDLLKNVGINIELDELIEMY